MAALLVDVYLSSFTRTVFVNNSNNKTATTIARFAFFFFFFPKLWLNSRF